ncbi:MAG TPA: hypothetical protein VNJ04_08145 [Gemmatimonadaceae bacterium]|nr:hypothetical protein [Gemmatimonadaceae bacterium]
MGTTTMDRPQTGLARTGVLGLARITSQDQYAQQLQLWQQQHVHALCPMVDFGALPEQYVLVPAMVKIDPNPDNGEVYFRPDICKPGEVALTAQGLQKIARCGGISLDSHRTDPRTIRLFWEFKAVASWTGFDGAREARSATKEWDMRDGSDQLKGMTDKQIGEARKHGARHAETRAISAVIRQFGVRQKYKATDLAKPFGLVRVVYQPNMNDPVQRAIVTQQALGGAAAFAPPQALPAAHTDVIDAQLADPPAPASPRTPPPAADPDFEELPAAAPAPPAPTAYRVVKAGMQKRDAAGLGPLYIFEMEPAATFYTEDAALARTGAEAKKADARVEIDHERKGDERWILEIRQVAAPLAAAEPTQPAGTCFVAQVEEKSGVKQVQGKPDRPWTRYTITLSTGEFGTTFSKSLASVALEARDKRLPVTATFEDNPAYPDQQTLAALTIVDPHPPSILTSEL